MLNELILPTEEQVDNEMLFKLLPCQWRYVLNNAQILGVEKGRQLGFTWVSAYKILRKGPLSKTPRDTYWISRDEFTAKQFLNDVKQWIQFIEIRMNYKKTIKAKFVEDKGLQTMKIAFDNGSNIFVMSSSPDAIAGKRGDIYIDEAALLKDFRQLYDIAKPAIRWGFNLTFFSTHRSKTNYFCKMIKKIKDGEIPNAEVMTITLIDALNEGYLNVLNFKKKLLNQNPYTSNDDYFEEEKSQASSEEMFLQENMCIPADADATQAVKEDELDKIMFAQHDIFTPPSKKARYFAGIDIGRNRDLTVIWIAEDVSTSKEPMLITRFMEIMSKTEFSVQERRIADILLRWRPKHCCIDGTNVGAQIGEDLEKRFGFCKSVKLTAVTRPRFISDFVSYIRRDPVAMKIPNSNEIWEDFLSVERYINKYGKEDFFIPSHRERGHGDRFMAAVLCLQAFLSKRSMAKYTLQREGTVTTEEEKKKPARKWRKPNVKQRFKY